MGIILGILLAMFGPPILFLVMGIKAKPDKKKAKLFYIAAVVYLIVGLGTCYTALNNLNFH